MGCNSVRLMLSHPPPPPTKKVDGIAVFSLVFIIKMCFTFQIGWYNENVQELFALPFEPNTLAFIVISTPAMFDKAFKPFICRQSCDQQRDLIDECMIHHFNLIKEVCWQFSYGVYECVLFL